MKKRGAEFVTRYTVETRYPGDSATKRQAMAARRWMLRVREAVRPLLGL